MPSQLTLYVSPSDTASQQLLREAGARGLLRGVTVRSLGNPESRAWLVRHVGEFSSPLVLLVRSPAPRLVATLPQIVSELQSFAGLAAGIGAGPVHGAPAAIAYVSRTCGACQQFLQLLASSPALLQRVEVRAIEDDPRHFLAMQELGAYMTPTLVVHGPSGRMTYSGPSASQALIAML